MQLKRQNSIISKLTNNPLIQAKKQRSLIQTQIKEEQEEASFTSSDFSSQSSSSSSPEIKPKSSVIISESSSDQNKGQRS